MLDENCKYGNCTGLPGAVELERGARGRGLATITGDGWELCSVLQRQT